MPSHSIFCQFYALSPVKRGSYQRDCGRRGTRSRGGVYMDTQFVWKDEYNIGVEMIDKEHQRLFKIINKLFAFREEEKDSQWTCQEGIKYFRSHAMKHFMDEEAYMLSIGYEGLEQHRLIHKGFRENTLPALEQELERTGYAPDAVNHFLGVCAGWLTMLRMVSGSTMAKSPPTTPKNTKRETSVPTTLARRNAIFFSLNLHAETRYTLRTTAL